MKAVKPREPFVNPNTSAPETPAENLDTNDRWLRENIPPHFGKL